MTNVVSLPVIRLGDLFDKTRASEELPLADMARVLRINQQTAFKWYQAGLLPAFKRGNRIYCAFGPVAEFLNVRGVGESGLKRRA